ncbi:hypothetical protein IU510_19220 [Nocardia cyriacigeorgica]|nr:hypothetical protein [Nocardia cyriacigeorgica]MBF6100193.1 hypothetical protein [Nocardia cyriacigeorgica]
MREFVVALIFSAICAVSVYMAVRGWRGTATNLTDGWGERMPERSLTDPVGRARANRIFAYCGSAAALLCLPAIGYALAAAMDTERALGLPALVALAVYGIVVCAVAGYPLEKIEE